jgi:general secretion pathway protein G
MGRQRIRSDRGFSLVELLIVIVVLGILATVTVFAVRGITAEGTTNACTADALTMSKAEEAYFAIEERYGTEAEMVSAQVLKAESTMHDITLGTDSYTIAGTAACATAATTTTT